MKSFAAIAVLVFLAGCGREGPSPTALDPNLPETDLTNCVEKRVARVGGADTAPVVVSRIEPRFPPDAPAGVLIVETVITRAGEVCAARVLRGLSAAADDAALTAVRQWQFVPAKKMGQPVQAAYNIALKNE
jgi:TonB family protein